MRGVPQELELIGKHIDVLGALACRNDLRYFWQHPNTDILTNKINRNNLNISDNIVNKARVKRNTSAKILPCPYKDQLNQSACTEVMQAATETLPVSDIIP